MYLFPNSVQPEQKNLRTAQSSRGVGSGSGGSAGVNT